MSSEEARQIAAGNPLSFLHVSKPEIDLPPGTDVHAPEVYAKGRENFQQLIAQGAAPAGRAAVFLPLPPGHGPAQPDRSRRRRQLRGIPEGRHQKARVDPPGQGGRPRAPYRSAQFPDRPGVSRSIAPCPRWTHSSRRRSPKCRTWISPPATACATPPGPSATPTASSSSRQSSRRCRASTSPMAIIAAPRRRGFSRAAKARAKAAIFLSVIFPHNQMQILPYNRVLKDLNGLSAASSCWRNWTACFDHTAPASADADAQA